MYRRHAFTLGILLLGCAGAASSQTEAVDPWAGVPAMPKNYFSDDDFIARVDTEYAAINADIDKQAKLNAELKKSFGPKE